MKLLVADDSRVYRSVLRSLLEGWGYEVILAADGDEARSILICHDAPRIALLDCMMPGLTGLELCQLIRRGPNYIYTILLSANDEQTQAMKGFELGADDYLGKPFHELELKARLKVGERIIRTQEELIEARESFPSQIKRRQMHECIIRGFQRTICLTRQFGKQ